jgi:hypothetical protein
VWSGHLLNPREPYFPDPSGSASWGASNRLPEHGASGAGLAEMMTEAWSEGEPSPRKRA